MLFELILLGTLACTEPEPCDSLMAAGDRLRDAGRMEDALHHFERTVAACPDRSEPYWMLGRSLMETANDEYSGTGRGISDKEKMRRFRRALTLTRTAISRRPTDHRAWELTSIAYGGIISVSSLKQQALLADSVRLCAEESARLDPTNDTPWHILGRWHYEVARLGWLIHQFSEFFFGTAPEGSYQKAEEYFRRAIAASDAPLNRYWLAQTLEAQNKQREAREQYRIIVNRATTKAYHNDSVFVSRARKKLR